MMAPRLAVLAATLLASCGAGPQPAGTKVDPAALVGRWKVDLRPTPDAAAYFQEMVIESVGEGRVTGSFYGTPFRSGRINDDWGAVEFAFVTEDGSGVYHTSGTLRGDRIEGRTHAVGRDFLGVWSAERQ